MTASTIADLRRELEKTRTVLIASQTHLAAHAEANAALHCSTAVMYSPLHAQVSGAIAGIEHALARTEQAFIDASRDPAAGPDRTMERLGSILLDLDRCLHGRHSADQCGGCGGQSRGNPQIRPGEVIGYTVHAEAIVIPEPAKRHDPEAWKVARDA